MPGIDPASITDDNIPAVLGAILIEIRDIKSEQTDIKNVLDDHTECLEIFKFSKCKLMPWMGRNRWILAAIFGGFSLWISSLDWLNRWLQWAFFPPGVGP
jgi:hypothetical protein